MAPEVAKPDGENMGLPKAGAAAAAGPAKACSLEGAALDLGRLRDDNRAEIVDLLDGMVGTKALVLDPALGGRLNHVLVEGASLLRESGVEHFRELRGELASFDTGGRRPDRVVYFVRALVPHMAVIAQHVKAAVRRGDYAGGLQYDVVMIPRRTAACEQVFEDEAVGPYVTVHEFALDLVAFDRDVVSCELDQCFADLHVHGDGSVLELVADAAMKLEALFGIPLTYRALGPAAQGVLHRIAAQHARSDALRDKRSETFEPRADLFGAVVPEPDRDDADWEDRVARTEVATCVVLDRIIDLVTPMVTPLTYEGLIDELLGGIRNSAVKVPKDVIGGDEDEGAAAANAAAGGKKKKKEDEAASSSSSSDLVSVSLNSNDQLYAEVRDQNIEHLKIHLSTRAKEIRSLYDSFRSKKDASITDIHDFVKGIPGLTQNYKSLQAHINVTERLNKTTHSKAFRERWHTERSLLEGDVAYDALEELIALQEPPMQLLRMLCLQSLTGGGIRAAKYDFFRREVLQTYGFELVGTLWHLEKAGLLRRRADNVAAAILGGDSGGATSNFGSARKALRLIVDDVDAHEPADIAYVSSGYAPLSARLVELLGRSHGWAACSPALPFLPGPALDYAVRDFSRAELDQLFRLNSTRLLANTTAPTKKPPPPPPAAAASSSSSGRSKKAVMVVFYVGGVTYAEIAALRFLSVQPTFPYTIVIATTSIINGTTLIKSLVYEIENKLQR